MRPVVRCNQHGFHVLGHTSSLLYLLVESLAEISHQSGAARHDYVAVQSLPEVDVALLDARSHHVVHTWVLQTD